jgi:hypothetical protein
MRDVGIIHVIARRSGAADLKCGHH